VALVAGLGLWNAHLATRVRAAERTQAATAEVLAAVSHPRSHVVPLSDERRGGLSKVAASYVPGRRGLYVFGSLPDPQRGFVYRVWLLRSGTAVPAAVFRPGRGVVLLRLPVDATRFDELLITEELNAESSRPSGQHVVRGTLG
jgi:hypothetical protein